MSNAIDGTMYSLALPTRTQMSALVADATDYTAPGMPGSSVGGEPSSSTAHRRFVRLEEPRSYVRLWADWCAISSSSGRRSVMDRTGESPLPRTRDRFVLEAGPLKHPFVAVRGSPKASTQIQ